MRLTRGATTRPPDGTRAGRAPAPVLPTTIPATSRSSASATLAESVRSSPPARVLFRIANNPDFARCFTGVPGPRADCN